LGSSVARAANHYGRTAAARRPGNGATPAEAKSVVDAQAAAGYDFIKPHDGLPRTHTKPRLPRRRHITCQLPVMSEAGRRARRAQAHQASIEHAEQIVYHYFDGAHDAARLPVVARAIADARTFVTPTLAIIRQLQVQWDDHDSVLTEPEIKYTDPETYAWWRTDRVTIPRRITPWRPSSSRWCVSSATRRSHVGGTDYYLFGLLPGFGLHRELQTLVAAGLTPYEALETATRNPAELVGDMQESGTVAVGKIANLLVLDANPLLDIRNVSHRQGVVVRGRWLPAQTLDSWLDTIAASFTLELKLVDEVLAPGGARSCKHAPTRTFLSFSDRRLPW
jgi:hypothetical protein